MAKSKSRKKNTNATASKPNKKDVVLTHATKSTKEEDIEDIIATKVYLSELELAKLDGAQARRDLQTALMDKTKLQQDMLTVSYREQMAGLKALHRNHDASRREITDEYNDVLKSIEERLGITMSECTVADDGAVTHQDDIG